MSAPPLVWVITGCSSGIGRELAIATLERGDKVIATTRAKSLNDLEDLQARGAHIMELDVTARLEDLKAIAECAVGVYGKVDVVVNNAGFFLGGSIEETSHEDTLNQFNTNLFGAINVTRAFLPYMRERRTGTVVFIGSLSGWRAFAFGGLYAATKHALRGISTSLHLEISPFGLCSICFDLGWFRTTAIDKRQPYVSSVGAYRDAGETVDASILAHRGNERGDPVLASRRIVDMVRGEGIAVGKKNVPLNLVLGGDSYEAVKVQCEEQLERLKEWEELAFSTDYLL